MRDFLGDEVPVDSIQKIIEEADFNNDHLISYNEFLDMWNRDSEERLKVARQDVVRRRIISREPSFVSSISSTEDGFERDALLAELQAAEDLVSSAAFNDDIFPTGDMPHDYEKKDELQQDPIYI